MVAGLCSAKSVLVVDDDLETLTTTADAVECGGYATVVAANGEDALRVLGERDDIGLVIMDVQMPGLTGIEVLEKASHDEKLKGIPIVLMTAATQVTPPPSVLLLRKPFSLRQLLCVAAEYLGGVCPQGRPYACPSCVDSAKSRLAS
jgi:CheY-like chemotaxis protein